MANKQNNQEEIGIRKGKEIAYKKRQENHSEDSSQRFIARASTLRYSFEEEMRVQPMTVEQLPSALYASQNNEKSSKAKDLIWNPIDGWKDLSLSNAQLAEMTLDSNDSLLGNLLYLILVILLVLIVLSLIGNLGGGLIGTLIAVLIILLLLRLLGII